MLELDLLRLRRRGRVTLDDVLASEDPFWQESGLRFGSETRVRLEAKQVDQDVYISGSVAGRLICQCRRCLEPVAVPLDEQLSWFFRAGIDDVEAELEGVYALPASGQWLVLESVLREHILLAVPAFALCDEECKGFCQQCGAGLNEGICGCRADETDSRWAALRKLRDSGGQTTD